MGEMEFTNPTAFANAEFEASKETSAPLIKSIIHQDPYFQEDSTIPTTNKVQKKKAKKLSDMDNNIHNQLPIVKHRLMDSERERMVHPHGYPPYPTHLRNVTSPWAGVVF